METALEGVRILDLSRVLAGPFSSMLLGDLGADVIKVEAPNGSDETREWGPPYKGGESAYYLCTNRNKRSITIDFKQEKGKEIIKTLIKNTDVLIENFRTGKLKKMGLGYEEVKKINPGIIYCSITGFGQTGPYRNYPGYDYIVQAMGGLMSITGEENGPPVKVGVAVADLYTGLFAVIAILSALRVKEKTGEGQYIDLALLDAQVAMLANVASNYLIGGIIPKRFGNQHPNIVPYQAFKVSDGEIVVAVGNDEQFKRLCNLIDRNDLANNPLYQTNKERNINRKSLIQELQQIFLTKSKNEWFQLLSKSDIPISPINSIDKVFENPQLKVREMVVDITHPTAGKISIVNNPIKFSKTKVKITKHPPLAGEHTKEILLELGFSIADINRLKEEKII